MMLSLSITIYLMLQANTDVVVGASDGSRSFIQDRYAVTNYCLPLLLHMFLERWSTALGVMPRVDNSDDLLSTSVTRENGFTTISFIRALDTADRRDDISLSGDDRHFVYAWGGSVDYTTQDIRQHPLTPIVSTNRIILPDICLG